MLYPETFTRLRVDERPPVLNGGWWSPYQKRAHTVLGSTSVVTHVLPLATSKVRYENVQLSDVVIWTRFS